MLGATRTARGPELVPAGIVIVTEVALQELIATGLPFKSTWLLLCEAPNPEPEITTAVPTDPVVAETALITGAGAAAVLMDTLSNVAVDKADVVSLVSAWRTYMLTALWFGMYLLHYPP